MKFNIHCFIIFVVFAAVLVKAWSKEDEEIFKINHDVKADLGDDVTFYSWLSLENGPKSSFEEINKAYRKLSRKIHPDKIKRNKFDSTKKFKAVKKKYTERYQRLSVVGQILRSRSKERYDFFLKNGFPKYRVNGGWLYEKFRPGLVSVIVGLFLLVGTFQYFVLKIQTKQNKKRLEATIYQIKQQAWPSGIPPADGSDRKMTNQFTGKSFIVKIDGSVHVIDDEDSTVLHHVDPDEIHEPTIHDTIITKLPIWVWNSSVGKALPSLHYTYVPPVPAKKNSVKDDEKLSHEEGAGKNKKGKNKNTDSREKITLPNGKVVYSRKKRS